MKRSGNGVELGNKVLRHESLKKWTTSLFLRASEMSILPQYILRRGDSGLDDNDVYGFPHREVKARIASVSNASRKTQVCVGSSIREIVDGIQNGEIVTREEKWSHFGDSILCLIKR